MLTLIIVQEILGAGTTWLVIQIARDIADGHVSLQSFGGIVLTQTLSYIAGAVSWIYAERAGFGTYAKYILRFARLNRHHTSALTDSAARERTEPFLTSETFHICFNLIYDLQFYLRLFFHLVFNALVFGYEIDAGLPMAYAFALVLLVGLQWSLRKPLATAYLRNQQMTNRMTARTYNAWDNVTTGNHYNFSIWYKDFRSRWQDALSAQIRAIMMREGWSAASGVIALIIILAATVAIAIQDAGNAALLIGLAATLPRQIEMTLDMHQLTAGMTDLMAIWTRIKGVCEHWSLEPNSRFADRVDYSRVELRIDGTTQICTSLAGALQVILGSPTGRVSIRGANGAGKSTLLAVLKAALRGRAYYWPSHDRLNFRFNTQTELSGEQAQADHAEQGQQEEEGPDAEELNANEVAQEKAGYSSGERQLKVLREISERTEFPVYLLDEWDANLDAGNRSRADALVGVLAQRARVIEISHHDRSGQNT